MRRPYYLLLLALPLALPASIFEDNSGLDRTTFGNWTFSGTGNRDNVLANGTVDNDYWMASNGGHFAKEAYTLKGGTKEAPGFVGIYKGAIGDSVYMDYTFTAAAAITTQDWIAKGTIWRTDAAYSGRLVYSVNVNGSGFTQAGATGYFGRASDGANYDMGTTASQFTLDGPEVDFSTDLSAFNIQTGDTVVYRFAMSGNDGAPGTQGRSTGIGVQLIPEPNTVFLAFGGAFLLYILFRRHR